jgi:multidrug resistance efflux pump
MTTDTRAAPPSANGDLVNRVQQLRLDNQVGAVKSGGGRGSWLPWVLCGLLAVTWAGVGVRWYRNAGTSPDPDGPASAPSAAPAVGSASSGVAASAAPGEILLQLKGNLIPSLQIAVSPTDVGGRVVEVHFKEGDRVKKDFILARLDPENYQRELEEAEYALAAARNRYRAEQPDAVRDIEIDQMTAELNEGIAARDSAEKEFERQRILRQSGSFSQQDYDKAEADLRGAKARVVRLEKTLALLKEGPRKEKLLSLENDMKAAQARRDRAQWRLDNCKIKAPIDGTVLTKKADIGSLVSPMSFNVASSLCEIADLSKLEVEMDVPERQITRVREKLDCRITADADPARVYRGYVDRVMPIADDSKNVIKVRVRVMLPKGEVPGSFLKPKMSVTVVMYNRDFAADANDQPWK